MFVKQCRSLISDAVRSEIVHMQYYMLNNVRGYKIFCRKMSNKRINENAKKITNITSQYSFRKKWGCPSLLAPYAKIKALFDFCRRLRQQPTLCVFI